MIHPSGDPDKAAARVPLCFRPTRTRCRRRWRTGPTRRGRPARSKQRRRRIARTTNAMQLRAPPRPRADLPQPDPSPAPTPTLQPGLCPLRHHILCSMFLRSQASTRQPPLRHLEQSRCSSSSLSSAFLYKGLICVEQAAVQIKPPITAPPGAEKTRRLTANQHSLHANVPFSPWPPTTTACSIMSVGATAFLCAMLLLGCRPEAMPMPNISATTEPRDHVFIARLMVHLHNQVLEVISSCHAAQDSTADGSGSCSSSRRHDRAHHCSRHTPDTCSELPPSLSLNHTRLRHR